MKYRLIAISFLLTTVLFCTQGCGEKDLGDWDTEKKENYVENRSLDFGPNVRYMEATKDQFGIQLQDWISNHPDRFVTAIGYDANGSGSNDANPPKGYFIIHYPDSLFNPFRIK